MLLAWITDIHLDMVGNLSSRLHSLAAEIINCDALLITGDISISSTLIQHLSMIEMIIAKPVYFVLGNHDYYGSTFGGVRRNVVDFCNSSSYLRYMNSVSYIKLGERKYLIGHDGWYDAQNGNPYGQSVLMNDWIQITNFNSALRASRGNSVIDKNIIIELSRMMAQESANNIAKKIKLIIKDSDHIVVMTHVPPFKESFNTSDKYREISSLEIMPWYTSKIMGDTLMSAAKTYPHVKFTVLSGHLHSHYDQDLLNNLTVKVGKAKYGNPQLASLISV